MRKVKVLGHELDIMFNMAVQIGFEEISGKPFDIKTLDTQTATMLAPISANRHWMRLLRIAGSFIFRPPSKPFS